jgi:hypothetical protein
MSVRLPPSGDDSQPGPRATQVDSRRAGSSETAHWDMSAPRQRSRSGNLPPAPRPPRALGDRLSQSLSRLRPTSYDPHAARVRIRLLRSNQGAILSLVPKPPRFVLLPTPEHEGKFRVGKHKITPDAPPANVPAPTANLAPPPHHMLPPPYRFPPLPRYNGPLGQLTYARPSLANVDRSNLRPQTTS